MTKVLLLYEENHGLLAIFNDYDTVIDWLIGENWLDKSTEACQGNDEISYNWLTIEEILGEDWEKEIRKMDIDRFNTFFVDVFRIEEERVYGAE